MRTIVILSGAGLSVESGIPTFRDSNGLWHNHKVEDVATPEGWRKDKELVLNFYAERFNNILQTQPNEAHYSIARLQDKFNVINVTQNIDDLLERAGCKNVWHFHGSINSRKCENHKDTGDCAGFCDYKVLHNEAVKLNEFCPNCQGQLRPDVVWFGEAVHFEFEQIRELVKEVKYNNGIFICIGTSGQVQPAASLIPLFSQVDHKYIIDKAPRRIGNYTLLEGLASVKMKELADQLLT
jgi:NAD-dependent deacetylase